MAMIDLLLLVLVGVSAVLGLLRGFVGTVVATVSWLLAALTSFRFGAVAGQWLDTASPPDAWHRVAGYLLVFIATLMLVAVAGWLIRAAVDAARLTALDRGLGLALGLLRGAALACGLVFVLGFTPLVGGESWQRSWLIPWLAPVAGWMRAQLSTPPVKQAVQLNADAQGLGNVPGSGDNARIGQAVVGRVVQDLAERASRPSGSGQTGWPASIEPSPQAAREAPRRDDLQGPSGP